MSIRKVIEIKVSFPASEFPYQEATLLKKLALEVPFLTLHSYNVSTSVAVPTPTVVAGS